MDPVNSSDLSLSSSSYSTSKPAAKSRSAPTSNQDDGAVPQKRLRSDEPTRDVFADNGHKLDAESPDSKILERLGLALSVKGEEGPELFTLLQNVSEDSDSTVYAKDLIRCDPSTWEAVIVARKATLVEELRQLEMLQNAQGSRQVPDNTPQCVSTWKSESATMKSWDLKYVGDTAGLLYEHLARHQKREYEYARYTSIIQSSGMGKSRAIDELSKKHMVVLLCLREDSEGFPPPDVDVRDWLLDAKTKIEAFTRASAFLCALFVSLLRFLKSDDSDAFLSSCGSEPSESLEARLHLLMTSGQSFSHQGELRKEFYAKVINLANKMLPLPSAPSEPMPSSPKVEFLPFKDENGNTVKHDLKEAIEELMKCLIKGFDVLKHYQPTLIISFDEAHLLTKTKNDPVNGPWSAFSELRRALRIIHFYPCTSIFLSTVGKINQFMPQSKNDHSSRIQKGQLDGNGMPPFCEPGFDQLAEKAISRRTTLDEVSALPFMTSLSRPLFASRYVTGDSDIKNTILIFALEKLLCKPVSTSEAFIRNLTDVEKMACISVRIPLEFNARTLRSREMERTLVEKHLRVCLSADTELDTATTVAPSEPILAEASYYIIMRRPAFDLPQCLLSELGRSGLDKGNRGELISMTLCLKARDAAATRLDTRIISVKDFIQELIADELHDEVLHSRPIRAGAPYDEADKPLEITFQDSQIYFNHFIKLRVGEVINRTYLWRVIARGAAVLCADFQYGVDILVPFLCWDPVLRVENVSAFFIQSKNDKKYQEKPDKLLFDMMNPYRLNFFNEGEKADVPVIRMVFALASSTPSVTALKPANRVQPSRKAKVQADTFTTFDIWCGKASQQTFKPIRDDNVYHELLLRSHIFPDVYKMKESEAAQNATRSMNPATDPHPAHWAQFSESL